MQILTPMVGFLLRTRTFEVGLGLPAQENYPVELQNIASR